MVDELTMAVVGARFENPRRKGRPTGNRQTEALMCEPGEAIELRPEPKNKHDANAIAVFSARKVQMGYLSADKTAIIHRAVGEARLPIAIFQEATGWGCWIRVGLGREPTLPPPRPREEPRAASTLGDEWDGVDWIPPDE